MQEYYTEDLAKFGYREIKMTNELLTAWMDKGLPDTFYADEVRPAFNMNSGCVFLTNSEYQVCMMNGEDLEIWHNLPYGGEEGFLCDLLELNPEALNSEDVEYIQQYAPEYGQTVTQA
jgi:hypothetical protein